MTRRSPILNEYPPGWPKRAPEIPTLDASKITANTLSGTKIIDASKIPGGKRITSETLLGSRARGLYQPIETTFDKDENND